jgi:hypothetical protein
MNINEIYTNNSNFLKPDDIKGKTPIVTIESISVHNGKDKQTGDDYSQLLLHFVGKDKVLGLNRTNANRIAELTKSDDTDDWIGTSIELYTEMIQVGADKKLGIRIMPKLPVQAAFSAPEPPDEFTGTIDDDSDVPF